MPFIGNQPALSYTSFAVQHFTTSATTSYTLDYSVANENEIRLVINNVVQQPGSSYAYTASGTTLTLSAATSATDTMYAVFLGKAVQTVTPASGSVTNAMIVDGTIAESKLASGVNTITEADQWRLTTTKTDNTDITANLERVDTSGFGRIGTGMTESSGIFSFPSTGIYLIIAQSLWKGNTSGFSYGGVSISFTQDNSSYVTHANNYCSVSANNYFQATFVNALLDVTDTSLCKVKFTRDASTSNAELRGNTTQTITGFTFLRLGDT